MGGVCHDIRVTKNFIYLSVYPGGLLAFNRDGKESRKIGNKGRGPGEYQYSMYFDIDSKGLVYVLDPIVKKIKVYSDVGIFLRDISLTDYRTVFDNIDFYKNSLILSEYLKLGNAEYNWIVIDTLGNLISQKKNSIPAFKSTVGADGGTYKFKDRLFYYNAYNDTVFSILPNLKYETSFLFSPGEQRLPRSDFDAIKELQNYIWFNFIFETSHFRVLNYSYMAKKSNVLIEKESKKSYLIKGRESNLTGTGLEFEGGITNDLDGGVMFQPENYFEENGWEYMIELLPPHILKSYVAGSEFKNSTPKYPEKKKELEKLANGIKETDNPILVMVKLKK